jgi:hypothetical protein
MARLFTNHITVQPDVRDIIYNKMKVQIIRVPLEMSKKINTLLIVRKSYLEIDWILPVFYQIKN